MEVVPTHPHPDVLALHALELLAGPARRALDRHLHRCGACRWITRTSSRTATSLALAIVPVAPPARLRARVLAGARASAAAAGQGPATGWEALAPGVLRRRLPGHAADAAGTWLVRITPGAGLPGDAHRHAARCVVVAGSIRVGESRLVAGDRMHLAAARGASGGAVSDEGCLLLMT